MQLNRSNKKDWYFFIKKTRVAIVLSLIIVVLGYICIKLLPQEIYPDTSSPIVYVSAQYNGASSSIMETTVANVIEAGLTGVDNLEYMQSECNDGYYYLTIYFKAGSNKDVNLLNVKNQLQEIDFQLPPEVQKEGVSAITTSGEKGAIILNLSSKNDSWEQLDLANYAKSNILDRLKMVEGVADATLSGIGDYSMRIWLDPQKMASLGVTANDINYALSEQNGQFVIGTLGAPPLETPQDRQMLIKADSLLSSVKDFENVVIKSSSAHGQVFLKDVARIELGSSDYSSYAMVGLKTTALIQIIPASGANMVELSNKLNKKVEQISRWLPPGLELSVIYDNATYMKESINEVIGTIFITILIVILVILLFLGDWVSTMVPCVTIPISLIGAFGILYLFHMTINMLTLFALILAVSVVVDDAIVVVENVNRHLLEGNSPKRATQLTMEEVGVTLVTMAIILMTVFFPICFIPGFTGILYKQFAVFLSSSIIISAVCALTLSPAMTSVMMTKNSDKEKFERGELGLWSKCYFLFNQLFGKLSHIYSDCVKIFVYNPKITITTYLCVLFLMVCIFSVIPKAFVPDEDQGIVYGSVYLNTSSTIQKSKSAVKKIISKISNVQGLDLNKLLIIGSENSATMYIQLKNWKDRDLNILQKIKRKLAHEQVDLSSFGLQHELSNILKDMDDVYINISTPAALGANANNGFEFNLVSMGNYKIEELSKYADNVVEELENNEKILSAYNTYSGAVPMYILHIDYKKAMALNISTQELTSTLSSLIGSTNVSNFTKNGKNYEVRMQADGRFRRDKNDLNKIYVRSNTGVMVPVTAVISLEEVQNASSILRFNQNRSVCIYAQKASGVSSGEVIKEIEKVAKQILPADISYEWSGSSLQVLESSRQTTFIIILALLFIYFFLVALYNSWSIPAVILIVSPVSIVGALIFLLMLGKPFDLYSQIGVITLIGLSAKQSILFVEFAMNQKDSNNVSIQNASILAANMRFRAILMTELSFLIGVIPMLFATGPSANSRISLAATVFGGMLTTVSIGAVLTPGFYAIVQGLVDKLPKPVEEEYYQDNNEDISNEETFF